MSVPQIVVVVILNRASSGPTSGMGFSSRTMRPGSTNIAALIFGICLLSILIALSLSLTRVHAVHYSHDINYERDQSPAYISHRDPSPQLVCLGEQGYSQQL